MKLTEEQKQGIKNFFGNKEYRGIISAIEKDDSFYNIFNPDGSVAFSKKEVVRFIVNNKKNRTNEDKIYWGTPDNLVKKLSNIFREIDTFTNFDSIKRIDIALHDINLFWKLRKNVLIDVEIKKIDRELDRLQFTKEHLLAEIEDEQSEEE